MVRRGEIEMRKVPFLMNIGKNEMTNGMRLNV